MKPSFHSRLLNGPFGDPGLYVRVLREGRALMFDLGATDTLSVRDVLKTTDIFISHTHMDHFIGFDAVLRLHLKRDLPLRLYGPEGFTDCVEGKLRSYAWNLIEEYPLTLYVAEVRDDVVVRSVFRAGNSFRRESAGTAPFSGVLLEEPSFMITAALLDHQIPCLAFSLREDRHINIDRDRLNRMGLPVGPWLSDLKQAIRRGTDNMTFHIGGRELGLTELRDIATITRGQKISYVVDALGSSANIAKICELAGGSDVLYIETYFSDDDRELARERYHLTAAEAGRIARAAGVARLETFHYSPRYADYPGKLAREAEMEFRKPQEQG